jgi:hypothetical protein
MERHLYIVQRCWFSEPQHFDDRPVDCLRLFTDQSAAQEFAAASAHAYAAGGSTRTILLPPAAIGGSTYAFLARGKLCWVRAVVPTVLEELATTAVAIISQGVVGGTGSPRRGKEQVHDCVVVGRNTVQNMSHVFLSNSANFIQLENVMEIPLGNSNTLTDWPDWEPTAVCENSCKRNNILDDSICMEPAKKRLCNIETLSMSIDS